MNDKLIKVVEYTIVLALVVYCIISFNTALPMIKKNYAKLQEDLAYSKLYDLYEKQEKECSTDFECQQINKKLTLLEMMR